MKMYKYASNVKDVLMRKEIPMPIEKTLKKVMVIGSGPIIIGQAAEFDYAGT